MLSDEVGLGKTIEACLILHRLLLSGRANRILVLVPESLVHQWFVEMLRRFNVWLHIFDAERCASIEAGEPGANPFLDDQLVLTSIGFLAGDPRRAEQSVAAGWDVLVVDEAHHLEWSEAAPSREYQFPRHAAVLRRLLAHDSQLEQRLAEAGQGHTGARLALLEELLDLHGPGRVLFRNTRAGMKGFPKRTAQLAKLDPGPEADHWLDRVSTEFAEDAGETRLQASSDLARDPRVLWLVELLRNLDPKKILVIARSLHSSTSGGAADKSGWWFGWFLFAIFQGGPPCFTQWAKNYRKVVTPCKTGPKTCVLGPKLVAGVGFEPTTFRL
jgi:ATP-dependent helicase HepA